MQTEMYSICIIYNETTAREKYITVCFEVRLHRISFYKRQEVYHIKVDLRNIHHRYIELLLVTKGHDYRKSIVFERKWQKVVLKDCVMIMYFKVIIKVNKCVTKKAYYNFVWQQITTYNISRDYWKCASKGQTICQNRGQHNSFKCVTPNRKSNSDGFIIAGSMDWYLSDRLAIERNPWSLKWSVLCAGNTLVTDGFPAQRASKAESFSMPWRCHIILPTACHPGPLSN